MPPKTKPEQKKQEPKKQELKKEQPKKQESKKEQQKIQQPSKQQSQQIKEFDDGKNQQPQQEMDPQTSKKKKQADMFKKYLEQTGIAMAFQVIFAEILDKKIEEHKVFTYTAMRLRQIGEDLEKIKLSKK